jgi:hypothetical protein
VFLQTKTPLTKKIKVFATVLSGDYQQVLLPDWNMLTDCYLVSFLTELQQEISFHCPLLATYLHVFLTGEENFTPVVLPFPPSNLIKTEVF